MKICSVEFSVDNGILTIGSADASDGDQPTLESLPANTVGQVFMSCRQQIAPVRVELWLSEGPPSVHELLSANITLPAGLIGVGETFMPPVLSWPVCAPGQSISMRIGVDDKSDASQVVVVINPRGSLFPSSRNRAVLATELAEYSTLADLGVVMAEHSFPLERMSSAVRIVRYGVEGGLAPARVGYGVETIVEWMRWLRADVSTDDLEGVNELIMDLIESDASPDRVARDVFSWFAGVLGMSLDDLLVARR